MKIIAIDGAEGSLGLSVSLDLCSTIILLGSTMIQKGYRGSLCNVLTILFEIMTL